MSREYCNVPLMMMTKYFIVCSGSGCSRMMERMARYTKRLALEKASLLTLHDNKVLQNKYMHEL